MEQGLAWAACSMQDLRLREYAHGPAPMAISHPPGDLEVPRCLQMWNEVSRGTVGHPVSCAAACKYTRRKGGCPDGADCLKCHMCVWTRDPLEHAPANHFAMPCYLEVSLLAKELEVSPCPPPAAEIPVPILHPLPGLDLPDNDYSLGTLGHPQNCSTPCKFVGKPRSCKDGKFCAYCHLCVWTRKAAKAVPDHRRPMAAYRL
eukprot:TRINITY_DN95579_c0_g1_i1.p1 TRINITY_DN95579_c0_g1~~TRINITY_DN95579_c0_g1_i1.p1  ORF type:complete len:231 (+),score=30.95 TRINITY_DN95579_c0_g1_i1:86-694(+)